ncbi:hypothetical protein BH18ACT9_BH18ACT9_12560 [soil metagenome]
MPSPAQATSRSTGRRVVIVAGAGRSGTSTLAGILRLIGFHVPEPEVAADATNPKGFSESQWVVDFHDGLLAKVNVQVSDARPTAWAQTSRLTHRPGPQRRLKQWLDEEFTAADELLVKDPRTSWFLGLWRNVVPQSGAEPVFATMLRPPAEVVGSKRTHYNQRLDDAPGVAAWVNMMLNTELVTRGSPRVFMEYQDLLTDWKSAMQLVGKALDLPATVDPPPEVLDAVDGFVDPGLRRVELTWDDLDLPERLHDIAHDSWALLRQLADQDSEETRAALDEVKTRYDGYYLESESVVRSSVIAARVAADRRATAQLMSVPAPAVPGQTPTRVDRWTHRTPHILRAMVPLAARTWVRRRLG